MKITSVKAIPISIPLEAPIRWAWGIRPVFTRTIIQIVIDDGIIGLGEVQGDQQINIEKLKNILIDEDPFHLEKIRSNIASPITIIASRIQKEIYAALEFACLDIQAKTLNRPLGDILGGRIRDKISLSGYLFFRYKKDGIGGEKTPDDMVKFSEEIIEKYGFKSIKFKGGVFPPKIEVNTFKLLRKKLGDKIELRIDPNGVWSVETSIRVAEEILEDKPEYLEDPTWGIVGMARVHKKTAIPLATNTCVLNFDQLADAIYMDAVDIILTDPHLWGGIIAVKQLAKMCETFGLGISMHSSGEFGVSLAIMLHTASVLPNLTHDTDAHYHHLTDDIIKGGKLKYKGGYMDVPEGPGIGVELDEEKLEKYHQFYKENKETDYCVHPEGRRDQRRPDWIPIVSQW